MSDRSPLRWILSFATIASMVVLNPASAAEDTSKPNTLTPKEIEEGWLLLFDGETTFGWKIDGDAKAIDGQLVIGGKKETVATTTTEFRDSEVRFSFSMQPAASAEFRAGAEPKEITGSITPTECKAVIQEGRIAAFLKKETDGGGTSESDFVAKGQPQRPSERTRTGISFRVPAKTKLSLSGMKLKPLDTKPLFNGKDLTGWRVFPGERYKSHFSVTQEGWLNVKNGPGDLQTEGQYDDFILQLECISNGKALNSGVFFRCVAGQYQNGYEAQIQNGYKDGDRSKPVDFGTGAIYRRVPARKVVSNDHEWFTMTVAAQGKHIATWVNGYQTVDWSDERPPNDNPRNGSKTGKGHISIQGHDPTTDLSFRNIRIAELPKEK
jgi:3-keto-disaccharide hydrolase